MKYRVLRLWKGIIAVGLAIALISCGGKSDNAATTQTDGKSQDANSSPLQYDGSDREQKLIEGAKKEGKLTFYGSLTETVSNPLVKKFNEKFPFIKVEIYRTDASNLVQRVNQEAKAGHNEVDVMESSDAAMLLREYGLISPYYSPAANKLPDSLRTPAEGKLVWDAKDRVSYVSFAYNKKFTPPTAVPKTMKDLLNPELKGKIAISTSSTGVRWIGAVLNSMGETEGRQFLQQLAANQNVRVEATSAVALMGLVAQGEIAASPNIFRNHLEVELAKGAPVEWIPLEPVVVNSGAVLVAKKAPHPNAAMLFVDFLLGEEGQAEFGKLGYTPPSAPVSFKFWVPESIAKNAQQYEQEYRKWQDLLKSNFMKK